MRRAVGERAEVYGAREIGGLRLRRLRDGQERVAINLNLEGVVEGRANRAEPGSEAERRTRPGGDAHHLAHSIRTGCVPTVAAHPGPVVAAERPRRSGRAARSHVAHRRAENGRALCPGGPGSARLERAVGDDVRAWDVLRRSARTDFKEDIVDEEVAV